MMGPHTSTEGNVTQAVLPRSNLCSSAFQDGLVQNNAQVISSGMASSKNILVSQNVLQQNNTWAALPKNSLSCSMTVPQTITQGSNIQAPIPSSKLLSSPLHDGLVQSNPQEILPDVAFSDNSTMPQNIPMQYPKNQLKHIYMLMKPNQQITQASEELGQNNTHATRSENKFRIKIMVPHTSTKESDTQVALPRSNVCSSAFQDGLVQNNAQVISSGMASSNDILVSQNVLQQNNTWTALPKKSFSASMTVPQTITQGSNIQAPIPSNKLLNSPLHNGLVQNNPQEILRDVTFSNNSTMPQNIPMQYPENQLKINYMVVKPNQQITQASEELGQNNTHATRSKDKFCSKMMVSHTSTKESDTQVALPRSNVCRSEFQDGLVQNNAQVISSGMESSNDILVSQNVLQQNNTWAALPKNSFSASMTVPQTITQGSNIQAPTPSSKLLSSPLHDGLVQSNLQEILPDVAFSNNSTMPPKIPMQYPKNQLKLILVVRPNQQIALAKNIRLRVPHTVATESNIQVLTPNNMPLSLTLHDGLAQSNPQEILPGVASSNNNPMLQNFREQNNSQAALLKNKFSSSMKVPWTIVKESNIQAPVSKNKLGNPLWHDPLQRDTLKVLPGMAFHSNRVTTKAVALQTSTLADLPKNNSCIQHFQDQQNKFDISGKYQKMTSTMPTHPVVWKNGQIVKENEYLKSDCVSLSSSTSNRQLVLADRAKNVLKSVKHISKQKSLAELSTPLSKASTENMIENKEVSSALETSSMTHIKFVHAVLRKDGQDVKENKFFKSVEFHRNIPAKEAPSESDYVSLSLSNAWSSNRQPVIEDGVKNSSVKKSVAELDTSHLKASTTENMIENKEVSGEQKASNMQQTSTKSIQPVVRKDGQDMKENESLKSVRFHGNMAAGETTSEPDCVSLPSSDARSSNRQLVIDDGVKNSSIKKSVAELDTSHLKASTTENMIENKKVSGEQRASNKKQTSTMSIQSVVRKDGQDVKENKSLKVVSSHGNIAAGETTSEPDCVSLSSSDACSSNRQLVIDDGVKNSSVKKSLASTKNIIENKEVSGEQQGSSTAGSDTDDEVLVIRECKSGANKCIDVVCHVCTSLVTVEKMLDMHLLFGQLKCKNCNLEIACCNMMKTYFYGNSFCSGNKHQGIHDFTVWCNDVIEYILYQLRRDLIIKNFCKYDRNIPVCDNDLYSELQDYVEKLAILRKYRPWNSALLYCDQFILSQMMSRKTYSVSNTNTHLTDSAVENSSKADLSSFQDSHSLEIICKKKETEKDLERDKAEYVRIKRKRGRPRLVASEWDFPKDKRYLKISVTGKSFSCPEECPECYFAICPSRFIMKVNDFTLKYTCVECHLPMFFVFESGEEKCKKRKRVK